MFLRLGVKQLVKNKSVLALSILTIALGVGILYTINISADTVQNAIESRMNFMFGNVDYAVRCNTKNFYDNTSYGIPYNYSNTIRSIPGVDRVVARSAAMVSYFGPDGTTPFSNDGIGIDVGNADEASIGIANVTSYMDAIGTGKKSLEEVLNYTGVVRPIVVSDVVTYMKGVSIGDEICIVPHNATKLYATPEELALATTPALRIQLEQSIRSNVTRMVNSTFTVVGVMIDGSEGTRKPVFKDTDSLEGLTPPDEGIYMRLNDSMKWVFNRNNGEVGFFLVDTSSTFSGGADAFSGTVTTAMGNTPVVATDVLAHFRGYIDYATMMIRVILSVLTVSAWISCGVLIKTITQMNIQQKMREIGVLRAIGFKKNSISEIIVSQTVVMSAIGTAIGLGIGLIPPQFFDVSEISQFLSYNKVYEMETAYIVVSLVSTFIAVIAGMLLPIVSGMLPLIKMRKWSVVEMMSPGYMQQHDTKKDKKRRGNHEKRKHA